jgi:hypothetical protein
MAFLRRQRRFHDRLKTIVGGRKSQRGRNPTSGLSDKLPEAPFRVKYCFPKYFVIFVY